MALEFTGIPVHLGPAAAQQVAGKAVRDAMFLSNFSVTTLPVVMAAAAVLSLGVVIGLSRLIMRYSPARVVPALITLSATGSAARP